jgi:serine/threonine protein kinase
MTNSSFITTALKKTLREAEICFESTNTYLLQLRAESAECDQEHQVHAQISGALEHYRAKLIPFLDLEDEIGSLEETILKLRRRKIAIDPDFENQLQTKEKARDSLVAEMQSLRDCINADFAQAKFPEIVWKATCEEVDGKRPADASVLMDQMVYLTDFREISTHPAHCPGKLVIGRSQQNGVMFALKVLDATDKVRQELKRWCFMKSQFVAKIHRVYQVEKNLHMCTDFYPNGSLRAWIQQRPASGLDLNEVVRIFKQIARGLCHAASFGMVYRDLKPENVLLNSTYDVVLTDFGTHRDDMSVAPISWNSPYVAPEVKETAGDIWRQHPLAVSGHPFGMMLLEALSDVPLDSNNRSTLLSKLQSKGAQHPALRVLAALIHHLTKQDVLTRTTINEALQVLNHEEHVAFGRSKELDAVIKSLQKRVIKPRTMTTLNFEAKRESLFQAVNSVDSKDFDQEWVWKRDDGKQFGLQEMLPHYVVAFIADGAIEVALPFKEAIQQVVSEVEAQANKEHGAEYLVSAILPLCKQYTFLPVMNGKLREYQKPGLRCLGRLLYKCSLSSETFPLTFGLSMHLHLTNSANSYFLESVVRSIGSLEEFDPVAAQRCRFILSEDYQSIETSNLTYSMVMLTAGIHVPPEYDKCILNNDKEYIITEFANALLYSQRKMAMDVISEGFALDKEFARSIETLNHVESTTLFFEDGHMSFDRVWKLFTFDREVSRNTWMWFKNALQKSSPLLLRCFLYHLLSQTALINLCQITCKVTILENVDVDATHFQFVPTLRFVVLPVCHSEEAFLTSFSDLLNVRPLLSRKPTLIVPTGAWYQCKCGYPYCISDTRLKASGELYGKDAHEFKKCPRCKDFIQSSAIMESAASLSNLHQTGANLSRENISRKETVPGSGFFSVERPMTSVEGLQAIDTSLKLHGGVRMMGMSFGEEEVDDDESPRTGASGTPGWEVVDRKDSAEPASAPSASSPYTRHWNDDPPSSASSTDSPKKSSKFSQKIRHSPLSEEQSPHEFDVEDDEEVEEEEEDEEEEEEELDEEDHDSLVRDSMDSIRIHRSARNSISKPGQPGDPSPFLPGSIKSPQSPPPTGRNNDDEQSDLVEDLSDHDIMESPEVLSLKKQESMHEEARSRGTSFNKNIESA